MNIKLIFSLLHFCDEMSDSQTDSESDSDYDLTPEEVTFKFAIKFNDLNPAGGVFRVLLLL